jgi:DNA replication protein DnaC
MASAWADILAQGESSTALSKWLIHRLLQDEHTVRATPSASHQMNMAKQTMHRDLPGFDFSASNGDQVLIKELAALGFINTAYNALLIGEPGTGKRHLATALTESGITQYGKRVRFYSTVIWSTSWNAKARRQSRADRPICYAWIW